MIKSKIKLNEFVVYIFFAVITFCKGLGLASSNKIYIIVFAIGTLGVILKSLNEKFTKKELLNIIFLILLGGLDFIFGKETTLLFTTIALISLKNTNIKKIIKVMFIARLISFVLMIFLPVLNVIPMNSMEFFRNGIFIKRTAFGFMHPNLAHSSFNIMVYLYLYLDYKKLNFKKVCLIEIANFVLYQCTYSRTGFIMGTIGIAFVFIIKIFPKFSKFVINKINIIYILLIIVTLICTIGYNKFDFINEIDTLLTGRIKYMSEVYNNYEIPLIKTDNYESILFDNGYIDLLYNSGLVAFIWVVVAQMKTNSQIKENGLITEGFLSILFMIYSFTESYYINILMNPSLVFLSYSIFQEKKKQSEDETIDKI